LPTIITLTSIKSIEHWSYTVLNLMMVSILYTRIRDRCEKPDIQEPFLREMLHEHEKLGKLF